jgi:hypothetical protein
MRMMLSVSIPVETGNAAAVKGNLYSAIQQILADLRPEAAYFTEHEGERHVFTIFDMRDSSQLPGISEPWFLAFNARVQVCPAMSLQDLTDGLHWLQLAVKSYGKTGA